MSTTKQPQTPKAQRNIWRSPVFRRLLGGPFVAVVSLLIGNLSALYGLNLETEQSKKLHDTASSNIVLTQFTANLDSLLGGLNTLGSGTYNLKYSVEQDKQALAVRQTLQSVKIPPEQHALVTSLLTEFDQLQPQLTQINDLATVDPNAAYVRWQSGTPNPAQRLADLTKNAHTVVSTLTNLQNDEFNSIGQNQQQALLLIPITFVISLLLTIALVVLSFSLMVKRLAAISTDIERLADGDLQLPGRLSGLQGNSHTHDEIRALELSYVRAVEKLRAPLQQIQQNANRISASSTEISNAADHQAASSNEQATAITEVTVTVEELNQTAVQIADAAASVAAAAEQALLSASHGQDAVRDSIIGMAMIRSRVNDITSRILALSAQSQRISEIIDLIDTMAGQTHILALNAAVESAGAGGEVGERFGVVASEVKKLAQRSAAATREVRAVIAQVQAATNAAVMATEDGLKETEKGVGLAHQSGDANEDIIGMVERTAQLANAISLATQQQRTASEQVVATMREIALSTRQTTASSQQAAHAAGDLSDIAGDLRAVSTGFHLPDNHDSLPPSDPPSGSTPLRALQVQETRT